jgi:hypothetical protein
LTALVAVMIAAPEVSAAAAKPSKTTSRPPSVNHRLTSVPHPKPPTVKKTIKVTPTQAKTVAKRATRVGTIQKKRRKHHGHGNGLVHGIVTGVQHSKSGGGAFEVRVLHKHHKHYASRKSGRRSFHAGVAKAMGRPAAAPTSVKRTTKSSTSGRRFYVTTHTVFLAMRGSRGATTSHHVPFADLKRGDDVLVFAQRSIAHKVDILGGQHKHHKTPKKKKNI